MADNTAAATPAPESPLKHFNDKVYPVLVWTLRTAIGAVFIFSGFAKAVDPWGFCYKISEYLNVWGITWLWREVILTGAVALAATEFTVGVLLLTGCLRKSICWIVLAIMLFMLPLTAYIWAFDPVSDCGCFGEALVISNAATFWKNVGITLGAIYLGANNHRVCCLFAPIIQWLVIVASMFYCIILSTIGFNIQPLVDFRPYPVGSRIIDDSQDDVTMVYVRDGVEKEFPIDSLPDSTWTYVRRIEPESLPEAHTFAVYDGEEDVTSAVISESGPQLILVVSNPKIHNRARASMTNNLNSYIQRIGGSMIGVVGTSPDSLARWVEIAKPTYDVFTSEDTSLKEIVRGDAGIVYINDGVIKWKRNLYSLPGDFPDFSAEGNQLDTVDVIDSGRLLKRITCLYLASLLVIFLLGLIRIRNAKNAKDAKSVKNDVKSSKNTKRADA